MEAWEMKQLLDRNVIAMRAAKELKAGDYVNLGMGIPTLCALFVPEGVLFQTENGALGYGPLLTEEEIDKADFHYYDAQGRFFSLAPGTVFFDIFTSFVMIRSGRMISVMGALQVSETGDLANWNTGAGALGGTIGGGMDLAMGAKRMIITMEHTTRAGTPRIVRQCSYPLTARQCVDLMITDVAVIQVGPEGLVLKELAPGWSADEVQELTEPRLAIDPHLKEMEL
jgi:3-oxoacid CoA-transferase B subunit